MVGHTRAIGEALLQRGLSADQPLVFHSGNGIEHMQMTLGAMWAGILYAPISPAYSLLSGGYGKALHANETKDPDVMLACRR